MTSKKTDWCWPINLSFYDCSPELTKEEWSALEALFELRKNRNTHTPPLIKQALDRLMQPVSDVLDFAEAGDRDRRGLNRLLLCFMHQRQASFWAWELDDWLEIICPTSEAFRQYHATDFHFRQYLIVFSYLVCGFSEVLSVFAKCKPYDFAVKVFGRSPIESSVNRVRKLLNEWGYGPQHSYICFRRVLCDALLLNRSPHLEDLNVAVLEQLRQSSKTAQLRRHIVMLSRALAGLGVIDCPLAQINPTFGEKSATKTGVPQRWVNWCDRWRATSTLAEKSRNNIYYLLLHAGRWLAEQHPEVDSPQEWTRELAAEYIAVVDRMSFGQWASSDRLPTEKISQPISAREKNSRISAMRAFFRDCQEWEWMPHRFDAGRCFTTPRPIRALIGPNPRIIEDDIWAKLLWAGLNLVKEDLPHAPDADPTYPFEMVRALVVLLLFAGLRSNEIHRLRVKCVRWQVGDVKVVGTETLLPEKAICWLDVPVNKTGTAFTKPVDPMIGKAIEEWERVRPQQPLALDPKVAEKVHYLFSYRGRQIGKTYINNVLIPMLCNKAGAPKSDSHGPITSHRARSTIASQLYNAKEPMTLFELQEWLGHRDPSSTQHYAKITPTKLAKSYSDAGYFERNRHMIEVLLDQENVRNRPLINGEPWMYYDLGHGYCTYDFFNQCPHRMACARCDFYLPKGSAQAQLLEGKTNLLRMKQEIPLTDEEVAAVDDGILLMEKLCQKLDDVPTPAGPTPRDLRSKICRELPILAVHRTSEGNNS